MSRRALGRAGGLLAMLLSTWAAPALADEPALARLRGDVTVLAFWASWCAPCAEELPRLGALGRRFAGDRGVRVVAVDVDEAETRAGADEQWGEAGLALPLVPDGAALLTRLIPEVREPTLPLLLVIDRHDRGYWHSGVHQSATALARDVAAAVARLRAGGPAPRGWTATGGATHAASSSDAGTTPAAPGRAP